MANKIVASQRMLSNTRLLRAHLAHLAGSSGLVITELDILANDLGLDVEEVRSSAAVLMFQGSVADIQQTECGKLVIELQGG